MFVCLCVCASVCVVELHAEWKSLCLLCKGIDKCVVCVLCCAVA